MKRTICILLACMLVLIAMPMMSFASSSSTYKELWAQKEEYEKDLVGVGLSENNWNVYYEANWNFVLYTNVGGNLTFEVMEGEEVINYYDYIGLYEPYLMGIEVNEQKILYSKELEDIKKKCYKIPTSDQPGVCSYRKLIQTLGISETELRAAYRKMKEEPESARQALSCLTEDEFAAYVEQVRQFQPPMEFVIKAACMENEVEAQYLLSKTGAVYVPELGYALLTDEDFIGIPAEEIAQYDLTTEGFGYYLKNLRKLIERGLYSGIQFVSDGRTAEEKLEYLESVREAQLKAAQTGDGAVTALWVIALALPAFAFVTIKRQKRI